MSEVILAMTHYDFLEWIIVGLEAFSVRLDQGADTDPRAEETYLVAIPRKYGPILRAGLSVSILSDEIEMVSLATQDLTYEAEVKVRNLGERWLPFSFKPHYNQIERLWVRRAGEREQGDEQPGQDEKLLGKMNMPAKADKPRRETKKNSPADADRSPRSRKQKKSGSEPTEQPPELPNVNSTEGSPR